MERISCISVIHCGVVGNIQAFHVCAPGSIPGDGTFCKFLNREKLIKQRKKQTNKERKRDKENKQTIQSI